MTDNLKHTHRLVATTIAWTANLIPETGLACGFLPGLSDASEGSAALMLIPALLATAGCATFFYLIRGD